MNHIKISETWQAADFLQIIWYNKQDKLINLLSVSATISNSYLADKVNTTNQITTRNNRVYMSVRKKGRRKIVCDNHIYVWYVELDYDSPYYILNVISEDKQLIISCPLNMKTSYIISKGNFFQNLKRNGHWNRYLLPFDVPDIITPKFVSELIFWVTDGSDAIKIEWNGKDILV